MNAWTTQAALLAFNYRYAIFLAIHATNLFVQEEMDGDLPAEASGILRSEMDRLIQDRVRNDPDMDAKKFPNAAKRFHP